MRNKILVTGIDKDKDNMYRCSLCSDKVTTDGRIVLNVIGNSYYVDIQAVICKECFDVLSSSFTDKK